MLLDDLLAEWDLRPEGDPLAPGIVPVRTRADRDAVLKLGATPAGDEHLALTRWEGRGAVRLHRADPRRGALLLDRLGEDLAEAWDVEACERIGHLYDVLHRPVGRPFRPLSDLAEAWARLFEERLRDGPLPRRVLDQARALARAFARDDGTDGVLVHGDLHYGHVLADGTGAVAAISPDPLSGDPHFEPAPLLWHRFEELAGDLRGGLRRRFHAVVDAAELDEDRARDWVIVRAAARALADPGPGTLTACVAIVKAVQD